jgi:hypothetical protein
VEYVKRLKKIADSELAKKDKVFFSKDEAIAEAKKRKHSVDKDKDTTAGVDYIVYTPDNHKTYEIMSVVDKENPGMPADSIVFCTCDE